MHYPKLLEKLREIGESTVIRKKSHVAYQGEVPRYAYYILDGSLKAYVISPDGNETIADIYSRHTVVPVAWLNRTSPTAIFYYEALSDVRAIRFSRQEFERVIVEDEQAKSDYMNYLASAQTAQLFRNAGLCQSTAERKICYTLYQLVYRYGVERGAGEFMIPIPLTHEIIGNFIGQSRENTAKTVKKLSNEQLFTYESKTYSVNLPRLENYLGEEGFRELIAS
ncbi:hypothetical protein B7Y94_01055 [Candidatus Saccharibacteria bacterium 32-49-12]|nr:MAG: hypothetical protein B7Y94_01055 [Candidatus Saccharibacteria bacterium 32-49-12]